MKYIDLSQGYQAIVDDEDYDWLMQWSWHYHLSGYASHTKSKKEVAEDPSSTRIWMHRLINKTPSDMFTDHANGNKLDNRRENLRSCTKSENQANRNTKRKSKFKRVQKHSSTTWQAYLGTQYLGSFTTEESAANAYNYYAKKKYGEFALLNDVEYIENWSEYQIKGTSRFRGVSKSSKNRWRSQMYVNKHAYNLGNFDTELEAAIAFNNEGIKIGLDLNKLNRDDYGEILL